MIVVRPTNPHSGRYITSDRPGKNTGRAARGTSPECAKLELRLPPGSERDRAGAPVHNRLDTLRSQKVARGGDVKGAKKIDKEIERQEALLGELQDFAGKLERAAKLNFGKRILLTAENAEGRGRGRGRD